MQRFFILILALVSSLLFSATPRRFAIIVGAQKYLPGSELPNLKYASADAAELAAVLKANAYEVVLLTEEEAVKNNDGRLAPDSHNVRTRLKEIFTRQDLTEDDTVLVALAGHGVAFPSTDKDGRSFHRFYFCPNDASMKDRDRARFIALDEVYQALEDSRAGYKLLLVDACRNTPGARAVASVTLPVLPAPNGGTLAFFACSKGQQAFEDDTLKHGVFFHHVIAALKGDADTETKVRPKDGLITVNELLAHVSDGVADFVHTQKNSDQVPEWKGQFRRGLVLAKAAGLSDRPPRVVSPPPAVKPTAPVTTPSGTSDVEKVFGPDSLPRTKVAVSFSLAPFAGRSLRQGHHIFAQAKYDLSTLQIKELDPFPQDKTRFGTPERLAFVSTQRQFDLGGVKPANLVVKVAYQTRHRGWRLAHEGLNLGKLDFELVDEHFEGYVILNPNQRAHFWELQKTVSTGAFGATLDDPLTEMRLRFYHDRADNLFRVANDLTIKILPEAQGPAATP